MCEHFGWTPNQLDDQPAVVINRFLEIMFIKRQTEQLNEQQELEAAQRGH